MPIWSPAKIPVSFILFILLFPLCGMADDMPKSPAGGEALDLRGVTGGYHYASDNDDCFDGDFLKKGITFEFWFCPARPTERGEWWNLLSKPICFSPGYSAIYQMRIVHYVGTEGREWMRMDRDGAAWAIWDVAGGAIYEPTWHHIALQAHISTNNVGPGLEGFVFMDGVSRGSFSSHSSSYRFDSEHPLYVGGLPAEAELRLYNGEQYIFSKVTTLDGLIDELRISSVERYPAKGPDEEVDIKKKFTPDEHTVALWHFDEGPRALRYEDASGNGHTLFASGTIDVSQKDKLCTVWGAIKKQE